MSHETLEWLNNNTLIGFTDKRGKAWHHRASDQGAEPNHYSGPIPVADVIRRLFHWDAVAVPLAIDVSGPLDVESPAWKALENRKAIVRSDTLELLGIFADSYLSHQYKRWLIDTVADLLDDGLAVGSAGLLRNGGQAWVSVEVPDTITTPEGVQFRPNLLACTSHDGSLATTFKRAVTNVICDNTLAAGLGEAGQVFKAKHSRHSGMKLNKAREALGIVHQVADGFAAEVKALCEIKVTDEAWSMFLDAHTPLPEEKGRALTLAENKRSQLTKLWVSDDRVSPWKGTAFGVLQAVNTYTHHFAPIRGAHRPERNMSNTVTGEIAAIDQATVRTLAKVLAAL
jgi:phage/plasmid-like protein (TIGR03299 family)